MKLFHYKYILLLADFLFFGIYFGKLVVFYLWISNNYFDFLVYYNDNIMLILKSNLSKLIFFHPIKRYIQSNSEAVSSKSFVHSIRLKAFLHNVCMRTKTFVNEKTILLKNKNQ